MIYLISQITFIFLTQIYYEFHHIVISFITKFPWHFEINLCWLLLEDFFCSTQQMHISEYVCKSCVKELGICWNAGKPLKNFFEPATLVKILVFQFFFFTGFWQLYFNNMNFLTKTKRCQLCWLLWILNLLRWLANHISKKVNPMKYPGNIQYR